MDSEGKVRDCWDKAEILGKITGAVIVPVVVGVTALWWNGQGNQRQVAAQMSGLAIGILQAEDRQGKANRALREWAVKVLQNPASPPPIDDRAAAELISNGLPEISRLKSLLMAQQLSELRQAFEMLAEQDSTQQGAAPSDGR